MFTNSVTAIHTCDLPQRGIKLCHCCNITNGWKLIMTSMYGISKNDVTSRFEGIVPRSAGYL